MIRDAQDTDAAAIARVQVDTWRAAYAGLMPDDVLSGLSYESGTKRWQETLTTYRSRHVAVVAEVDAIGVVGFALGGAERGHMPDYDGELFALYVLPRYQGAGFGRALVQDFAAKLIEYDKSNLIVWVLRDNLPARGFYEAMGGVYVKEQDITIGGAMLPEVAYGWPDIHTLVSQR